MTTGAKSSSIPVEMAEVKIGLPFSIKVATLLIIGVIGTFSLKGDESPKPQLPPSSELLAIPGVKARLETYLKNRNDQINNLVAKYHSAIDTRINAAANAGDIELATAFQGEKKRVDTLQKKRADRTVDPVATTLAVAVVLDDLPAKPPKDLVNLRKTWATEQSKIRGRLAGHLQDWLETLEIELTKSRDFENARRLLAFRRNFIVPRLKSPASKVTIPAKIVKGADAATKEKPFENSLGMRFVPVPITGGLSDGQRVLFSVWETRVKDYAAFIKRDRKRVWTEPRFEQKGDYPALNIRWEDAVAFCEWLTELDRRKGKLGKGEYYRLPTDHEWSCAVGIEESAELLPSFKDGQIDGNFPWGKNFPPPMGAGNFYGEETKRDPYPNRSPIQGYDDGYDRTAPVGSFAANEFGLYDMGGNVWEWCEDWYSAKKELRVMRGSSWYNYTRWAILSSRRSPQKTDIIRGISGFRCVLVR